MPRSRSQSARRMSKRQMPEAYAINSLRDQLHMLGSRRSHICITFRFVGGVRPVLLTCASFIFYLELHCTLFRFCCCSLLLSCVGFCLYFFNKNISFLGRLLSFVFVASVLLFATLLVWVSRLMVWRLRCICSDSIILRTSV